MTVIEPTPLDLAHDDLADLDRTIAKLQKEREGVVAFIERYGKYVRPIPETPRRRPPPPASNLPMSAQVTTFMAKFLEDGDKPMPLTEFFPVLEKHGLVPGGTNPKQAVSAILGKDSRFTFVPKKGWKRTPTGELPEGLKRADTLNLT